MNTRKIFLSVIVLAVMLATVGVASANEEQCVFDAVLLEPEDCICPAEAVPIVINLTYSGHGCKGDCTVESVAVEINGVTTSLDCSECESASCFPTEEKTCNCTGTFDSTGLDNCTDNVTARICYEDCNETSGKCVDILAGKVDIDNIAPTIELGGEMESDICVCEGEIVDLEVDVEDVCCSGLNESTVKAVVNQDGEPVKTVNMTCGECPCWSEEGELNTTGMGGEYTITFTAKDECGNVGSATLVNLTVDVEPPTINEAKAIPDTISLIGMMDWWGGGCDPWDVIDCDCEACEQTHSFGPWQTTLVVNVTDECIGVDSVTMNFSAIIYQLFENPISDFSEEEREVFDEVLAEWSDELLEPCCENSYCTGLCVPRIVFTFVEACDRAGIDISEENLAMILMEKVELGDVDIPLKAEDECGNNVTGSVTLTIVDYQIPMKKQWNVRSVPITLDVSKWGEIVALGDGLKHDGAYRFDAEAQVFKKVTEDYKIKPLEGFYIHMTERDQMAILLEKDMTAPPTRVLSRGYNLIGPAILPFETMRADLCLKSIELTPTGLPGYTNVISLQQLLEYEEEFESECGCMDSIDKWYVQKPWVFTVGQEWDHETTGWAHEECMGYCYGNCSENCTSVCDGYGLETCDAECGMTCNGSGTETCKATCSGICEGNCTGAGVEVCNASCSMECEGNGGEYCNTTCDTECYGNGTATCNATCESRCELECGCSAYCGAVDLVQKNQSAGWSVVPGGKNGTLSYSMGADEVMSYEFTMNSKLTPNTDYCLVFYTRNSTGTWNPDTVWGNQSSGLIDSGTTDGAGNLVTLKGTFDFKDYGFGLEYINDGKDYDGSVYGAKVWLVPCDNYDSVNKKVVNWNSDAFLFEEDLITPTGSCCEGYGECHSNCTADCYAESFETCHGSCYSNCIGWSYEECHGNCTATCEAESYEECYVECKGNCTQVCEAESEASCYGGCIAICVAESHEVCYGDCYGDCYLDCYDECWSDWGETYGEVEDPKLGQDHYLCKYWMDNAAAYWVYMENPDTLAGFTTTPVYMIDLDWF